MIAAADAATAREALLRWAESGGVPSFRGHTGSTVYATRLEGRTCFLRLTDAGFRSLADTHAELAFIEHLAGAGIAVARPIPSRGSLLVEEVGLFHAVMFARAPGFFVQPDSEHWSAAFFRRYGATLACMHRAARSFSTDGLDWRSDWTAEPVLVEGLSRIRAADAPLAAKLDRLWRALDDENEAFGESAMVHADYAPQNVRYLPSGAIAVFDFANCCRHWLLYDLAVAIHVLRHAPDREMLRSWVIEGYRSAMPLPGDLCLLDLLLQLRSVYVYCDRLFRFGSKPSADQSANLEQMRELLLSGRAW